MKRKTAAVLLFGLLFACGQADRVPGDVLPKEKMRDILLDMNFADVYGREQMDTVRIADSIREQNVKRYYVQILQIHGVTREEFMRSYRFYEGHPDRLEEVYKAMQEVLARKKAVIDSLERAKIDALTVKDPVTKDTTRWPNKDIRKLILP
ncbi:DUF4296 domain-containing protein [Chitinophaga cymbidii]|uniref:DUF4296 domain-containing protein n=1 Tax=Chitinophaga cymbidii TaxID=1096750 RepID=A0A512RJW5_9BACT|nr:DUF4296 domain-containing protein [Chitinophaga cymbidii]GEP95968.1 hypothetical protein CCY01nite_22280 [Chitinophaga cymbidii]